MKTSLIGLLLVIGVLSIACAINALHRPRLQGHLIVTSVVCFMVAGWIGMSRK